ncbi:MAG: glutamyl-tRNA reductase [Candidatus Rokubacteria bacterium]|nr:glutamyl-tRNA reductase [Candidatus Rokubacteria bacterium]
MTTPDASFFVASVSHRRAPVGVRERLAMSAEDVRQALAGFEHLSESMIVSTCNRVEVYGVGDAALAGTVFDTLCARRSVDPALVRPLVWARSGAEAIRHCFRVAASLDSMIVGEPQILGQVKDAFAVARDAATAGPLLHRVMEQAFTVAKRVRTETALGQHAVSVPLAAVELARKIFGDLTGARALLIGAGEMGEIAARGLREQGLAALTIANRTRAKAEALAATLGGAAIAFDDWHAALAAVDIVITSTGAPEAVVTRSIVREAIARRGGRPLFFVDIAVPRDVEPAVADLSNVYCYDVDDLTAVVTANLRERAHEARRAEEIIEREVTRFIARLGGLAAVPTIVSLRRKVDALRQAEVERALARLRDASPETRQALEALSVALVNRMLHAPTVKLRETSEHGAGDRWASAVAELFALDEAAAGETPASTVPAPAAPGVTRYPATA